MNRFWEFYYNYLEPRLTSFIRSKWFLTAILGLIFILSLVFAVFCTIEVFN